MPDPASEAKPVKAAEPADEGKAAGRGRAAGDAISRAEWRRLSRVPKGKPAWDKDRTRALFKLYKETGSLEARDELVKSNLNLVRYLAAKFRDKSVPSEDLVQVGTEALIKAIDRYDPSRGNEFTTYATPTIQGEIKKYFRDKSWSVKPPRKVQELALKVNKAREELSVELSRSPTVDEIAERVGASVDDVLEAMESSTAFNAVSLESPSSNSDDDNDATVMDRYIETGDSEYDEMDDRLALEEVLDDLPEREREVIDMRFKEGLTQTEMAERLGISQVQVSRLLRKTLEKIREKMEPEA